MKRVMIYGDSITWGRIPGTTDRYDKDTRFTGVAANLLGNNFEIIEEGLRARMFSGDNPNFENRDGLNQFGPIFGSHVPLDLVVVMLGTNDTNTTTGKSAEEILASSNKYQESIKKWSTELEASPPKLLLVSPPLIIEASMNGDPMFVGAEQKTRDMATVLKRVASEIGAFFLDGSIVSGGELEGIHIDEAAHKILGAELSRKISELFE